MSSVGPCVSRAAHQVHLAFLLSDSRSGSTFLARNLHEKIQSVVVTPELNMNWAIQLINAGSNNSDAIVAALHKGRFFEALGQSSDGFASELKANDFATAIRSRMTKFSETTDKTEIKWVLVKKGHHAMQVKSLHNLFPEAKFICLHRDPRAVYESKMRTVRPYLTDETMAWSGIAGTTFRWRQYTRRLFEIEENLCGVRVRFEDLSHDLLGNIEKVAHALSASLNDGVSANYKIASKEVSIHDSAHKPNIDRASTEKWRFSLRSRDIAVIEALTKVEMIRLGYCSISTVGTFKCSAYLTIESLRSMGRLIARAIRRHVI